jgi:hypothetical protein
MDPHVRVPWEMPSLSGVLIGGCLFVTGWTLILTVIFIPIGIPMFITGLALVLTPKRRSTEGPKGE